MSLIPKRRGVSRTFSIPRRPWRLARLRRDQRGSAAVEFAIIAPLFFFLMFVIAETALVFIAEQVMDNAVFEAARLVRTGQVQKGTMDKAGFRTEVCNRMSVFVSCDDLYLEVKSFNDFNAIGTYLGGTGSSPVDSDGNFKSVGGLEFGPENQIVLVRAYSLWDTNPIFGSFSLASPSLNGKRLIGSFAAFRNEPFGPTGATTRN